MDIPRDDGNGAPGDAARPFNLTGLDRQALDELRPRFADCTLRDGEQHAGVSFSGPERVALARDLGQLGVYELEVGTPAVSPEDRDSIAEIAGLGLGARLTALARAKETDIRLVADVGMHGVRLSLPISLRQRAAKIPLDDDEYLDLARRSCAYAKELGLEVIFSPYDTTRAEREFLERVITTLSNEQLVDRVRLVDTAGVATPQAITALVGLVREAGDGVAVEVHCHNDLGMATANTVAGVLAGAEYASTTVNGIGERAGNAATEEVVMALEIAYGVPTGLRLEQFHAVSQRVQDASGVQLQPHKAVVGSNAFAHETGPVAEAVLKDPMTAECYSPDSVGNTRQIVLGKQSGLASVRFRLEALGVHVRPECLEDVLRLVRLHSATVGRAVADHELRTIVRAVAPTGSAADDQ